MLYIGCDLKIHSNLIKQSGIMVTTEHQLLWCPPDATLYDGILDAEKDYKICCISSRDCESEHDLTPDLFDTIALTLKVYLPEMSATYNSEINKIITTILNLSESNKLYEIALIQNNIISTIIFSSPKRKSFGPLSYGNPYITYRLKRVQVLV